MRVLAVRQPWASLIIEGLKTIEVRSKPTNIRERVAIYASTTKQGTIEGEHGVDYNYRILPTGQIVGTVEIVASSCCNDEIEYEIYKNEHRAHDEYFTYGKTYFWHLRRPIEFAEPVPYKPPRGAVVWSNFDMTEAYLSCGVEN